MLKTAFSAVFENHDNFFQDSLMDKLKKKIEIEIFCILINVFTIPFD